MSYWLRYNCGALRYRYSGGKRIHPGIVYVFLSADQQLLKIGRTVKSVPARLQAACKRFKQDFIVLREFSVTDSVKAEKAVHVALQDRRVTPVAELFFTCEEYFDSPVWPSINDAVAPYLLGDSL